VKAKDHLVEKLITTLHLNVSERAELGSNSISKVEVASAIWRLLTKVGWFPINARRWQTGEVVFEGHFLELLTTGGAKLWWQRSNSSDATRIAEQKCQEFSDVTQAIGEFVVQEWGARGIDGIPLE
jgi:hypothetical protein